MFSLEVSDLSDVLTHLDRSQFTVASTAHRGYSCLFPLRCCLSSDQAAFPQSQLPVRLPLESITYRQRSLRDSDISRNIRPVCRRWYRPVPERQTQSCGHPGIGRTLCGIGQSFHQPALFLLFQVQSSCRIVFLRLIHKWIVHLRNCPFL